eukprot:SAG31_NODE_2203_length_6199_cov_6.619836_7_plen_363_part_00
MIGEISALHAFVRGGTHSRPSLPTSEVTVLAPAHLGGVFSRGTNGWVVKKVYRGDEERPSSLSPLAALGCRVQAGDVITKVNGEPTAAATHLNELLLGTAGQQVRLSIVRASNIASTSSEEDVIVVPLSQPAAADLRYLEWELNCHDNCEQMSAGTIGYVHLRAMGGTDFADFAAQFYPVYHRQGLIIDVRHNRGGNIDSWVLEKLMRKAWFFWAARNRQPYWNMQYAFRGHIAILINQETASDGEAFAEGARRLGLGKIIGARTWGGEIWLSATAFAVADGGIASNGMNGVYDTEGKNWLIEGHGVDPDIEVDNMPYGTYMGADAQLSAAVAHLKELIEDDPRLVPAPPSFPDRKLGYPKL